MIEANGAEFLLALGRAAGAEVREDGRVRWAIGNSPIDYHNCVVGADLSPEEAGVEITASIERMRTHDVPGTWHVGPSMRPPDLGARLVAHGFEYGGDDIGTATDLSTLPEEVPVPATFAVERVRDRAGLAAWVETLGSGLGKGDPSRQNGSERCTSGWVSTETVRGGTTSDVWMASPWPQPRCSSGPGSQESTSCIRSSAPGVGVSGRPSRSRRFGRRGIWTYGLHRRRTGLL